MGIERIEGRQIHGRLVTNLQDQPSISRCGNDALCLTDEALLLPLWVHPEVEESKRVILWKMQDAQSLLPPHCSTPQHRTLMGRKHAAIGPKSFASHIPAIQSLTPRESACSTALQHLSPRAILL